MNEGHDTGARPGVPAWILHPSLRCIIVSSLLLTGCTVGPDYRAPKIEVPAGWIGAGTPPTTQPSATTQQSTDLIQWWENFNDPRLTSLVERAIDSNLNLQFAVIRIGQARASRRIVGAQQLPSVDTSASYRRSWDEFSRNRDSFRAGLDTSWEIDVFGGIRRRVEAADAEIRFTVEEARDVMVSLTAEVALTYVELRSVQRQIEIAKENLVTQRRSAELTRQRFGAGMISALDVAQADAQVARTESRIPLLEENARQTIYSLSELLGLEPGALLEELAAAAPIPVVPQQVPVGVPSDLLQRRPDIRRAEAQLHSATARIGIATADLFPRFNLFGSLDFSGDQISALTAWNNRSWSIGPSVSWPLFDAGRIRANIDIQNAAHEQALLGYRSTVLSALREVEGALIAYFKEQQRRQFIVAELAAVRRALDLSTRLYAQGETDFLNVLTAQRELLAAEDALLLSDRFMASNLIALYRALGGGWELEKE